MLHTKLDPKLPAEWEYHDHKSLYNIQNSGPLPSLSTRSERAPKAHTVRLLIHNYSANPKASPLLQPLYTSNTAARRQLRP
jgi:hypothetical protein